MQLTADQIEFYKQEGFLKLDRITTDEDIASLRESYDRIFAERAGRDTGDHFDLAGTDEDNAKASLPQILEPAKYAPEMEDSELVLNASLIAKQLLGEEAEIVIAHAILKPAHHGSETPWHQDAAYWDPNIIARSISIWVPLQPATLENGCMEFVPKSHEMDVLPHRSIGGDPRVHGLELAEEAQDAVTNVVACPLEAGGCTIHGGYMLHHAGPNRTGQPRRALILGANLPGIPRKEHRSFPWLEARDTVSGRKRAGRDQ